MRQRTRLGRYRRRAPRIQGKKRMVVWLQYRSDRSGWSYGTAHSLVSYFGSVIPLSQEKPVSSLNDRANNTVLDRYAPRQCPCVGVFRQSGAEIVRMVSQAPPTASKLRIVPQPGLTTFASSPIAGNQRCSSNPQAGTRTGVRLQQPDVFAARAGGKNHSFRDAKFHFSGL